MKVVDGELWIKSKTGILGYINQNNESFSDDGWFKTGDLVQEIYLKAVLSIIGDGVETHYRLGDVTSLIEHVEVEVGGQKIDKHYKEWMQIWAELTTPESKTLAYKNMTGSFSHSLNKTDLTSPVGANLIQIPILFWFCRNPGLALPLIALQYHEVKITLKFRTLDECIWARQEQNVFSNNENRRGDMTIYIGVILQYLIIRIVRSTKASNLPSLQRPTDSVSEIGTPSIEQKEGIALRDEYDVSTAILSA